MIQSPSLENFQKKDSASLEQDMSKQELVPKATLENLKCQVGVSKGNQLKAVSRTRGSIPNPRSESKEQHPYRYSSPIEKNWKYRRKSSSSSKKQGPAFKL